MKVFIFVAASLFFLKNFPTAKSQCIDNLVTDSVFDCTSPRIFTGSQLPRMPITGVKKLSITFDVQILDYCGADRNFSLLQMEYIDTSTGNHYNALDFGLYWRNPDYLLEFSSQSTTKTETYMNNVLGLSSNMLNQWFFVAGSVDFTSDSNGFGFSSNTLRDELNGYMVYVSTAIINSNCILKICPSPTHCRVRNLNIFYDYFNSYPMDLTLGLSATKIGSYALSENSGFVLSDSLTNVGTAYLGASTTSLDSTTSPLWRGTSAGLNFTSSNQYVRLPAFTVDTSTDTLRALKQSSFTFRTWIKPLKFPTGLNLQYLFRYSSSSMMVAIDSTGKIIGSSGSIVSSSNIPLIISTWSQVCVTFGYYQPITGASFLISMVYISIDKTWNVDAIEENPLTFSFPSASDIVRVGGPLSFIGEMYNFEIFSPGSLFREPSCQQQTCEFDLGFTNLAICLFPKCALGTFRIGSNCLTCPMGCENCTSNETCTSCTSGYVLQNQLCIQCPQATFSSGTSCLSISDCSANCNRCTNATSCIQCKNLFILDNNQCIPCASGTYYESGTCKTCSLGCENCTSNVSCTSCKSGYVLQNQECIQCPQATFSSGTNCLNCSPNCNRCTNSTSCIQCKNLFILDNNQCIPCASGTFYDSGICKTCNFMCSACLDQLSCSECKSPFVLEGNQCKECTKGTFNDGSVCKTCENECSECLSYFDCTECKQGFTLNGKVCIEEESSGLSGVAIAFIVIAGVAVFGIFLFFTCKYWYTSLLKRRKLRRIETKPIKTEPKHSLYGDKNDLDSSIATQNMNLDKSTVGLNPKEA